MEKSAPTHRNENKPLLHRGISSHQIFSDDKYVFKLTSTYETLTRYEVCVMEDISMVKSTVTYKRIPKGDPLVLKLSNLYHIRKHGTTEAFKGVRYDIYVLCEKKYENNKPKPIGFVGYRLIPKTGFNARSIEDFCYSDGMYFISEKIRR